MKLQIASANTDDTKRLAETIGKQLRGGEVIELVSDLGGGKTTFVHGLAKGIGSTERVASPTFTISRLYEGTRLQLYHFDFYRLQEAGLMEHELQDVLGEPDIVTVVEWGDVLAHVLPQKRLTIRLTRTGDESRRLELSCPESLDYLVGELA